MNQPTTPSGAVLFVNGACVQAQEASVSVRDRGFTLADGLFETMRVRRGVVFRLDRHLERLAHGLRVLAIPEPPEIRDWLARAIAEAGPGDFGVRLTVTRGPGPGGLAAAADPTPTVVIAVNPPPPVPAHTYTPGLQAITASGRRNPRAMTAGLKTLAYTDAVLAWLEARRAGADEAIFLDTDGHCSEATASNLFIYRDGTLMTPPLSCAALPGITRATVLELAATLGVTAVERTFDAPALASADEAFLTSSLRGVAPLHSVDGRALATPAPGPVTGRIMAAYRALVDQECGVS